MKILAEICWLQNDEADMCATDLRLVQAQQIMVVHKVKLIGVKPAKVSATTN